MMRLVLVILLTNAILLGSVMSIGRSGSCDCIQNSDMPDSSITQSDGVASGGCCDLSQPGEDDQPSDPEPCDSDTCPDSCCMTMPSPVMGSISGTQISVDIGVADHVFTDSGCELPQPHLLRLKRPPRVA